VATFGFRDELLVQLGTVLAERGAVVLCGLAGVGKTQVAARYAAERRGDFDLGWWATAENRLSLLASLVSCA
jgi:hypothetical protein